MNRIILLYIFILFSNLCFAQSPVGIIVEDTKIKENPNNISMIMNENTVITGVANKLYSWHFI